MCGVALLPQGDITGTDKPVLRGKLVLQQAVHCETWKPEEGGGAVELMTLSYRDLSGVHGFCLAIEGGCWLVQECEVLLFPPLFFPFFIAPSSCPTPPSLLHFPPSLCLYPPMKVHISVSRCMHAKFWEYKCTSWRVDTPPISIQVCIYLHTYVFTYIHKYIHTYIHTYIHAYI
jgi:hypothetical protein